MTNKLPYIFSAANLVSILRAFLIVPVIIALHSGHILLTLVLMAVGVLSDFLDGYVARHSRTVSSFGKMLDPIADKINIANLLIYLTAFRGLPWWFFTILLVRDLSIAASAAYLMNAHRKAFQANFSGKLSINFIALTIILYVIDWSPYKEYVMWLATGTLILSWGRYVRVYFIYLKIHLRRRAGGSNYA
ncbi:MAG TPA: CDP-alcohol phosphatidyltransferase family protein [bacterium]|nr:CDP-alcohol phosphatidyltransferase family protein [bacterium]